MSLTGQDEVLMAARRGKPSAGRIGRKPVSAQSRPVATHSGSTSTSRTSAPTLRVCPRSCSLADAAQVVVLDLVAATGPADLVLAPIRIPHILLRSRALPGTPRLRPAARARHSYENFCELLAVNMTIAWTYPEWSHSTPTQGRSRMCHPSFTSENLTEIPKNNAID